MATVIRKRFDDHNPELYGFKSTKPTMTQQQFKQECDVNNILAKYKKTGMLTHINKHQGNFGDFTSVGDYQNSLDKVLKAQESFEQLPSELRNKFGNDPAKLIGYLSDKNNHEEAIKYGLMLKKEKQVPIQQTIETALENHSKKVSKKKTSTNQD